MNIQTQQLLVSTYNNYLNLSQHELRTANAFREYGNMDRYQFHLNMAAAHSLDAQQLDDYLMNTPINEPELPFEPISARELGKLELVK